MGSPRCRRHGSGGGRVVTSRGDGSCTGTALSPVLAAAGRSRRRWWGRRVLWTSLFCLSAWALLTLVAGPARADGPTADPGTPRADRGADLVDSPESQVGSPPGAADDAHSAEVPVPTDADDPAGDAARPQDGTGSRGGASDAPGVPVSRAEVDVQRTASVDRVETSAPPPVVDSSSAADQSPHDTELDVDAGSVPNAVDPREQAEAAPASVIETADDPGSQPDVDTRVPGAPGAELDDQPAFEPGGRETGADAGPPTTRTPIATSPGGPEAVESVPAATSDDAVPVAEAVGSDPPAMADDAVPVAEEAVESGPPPSASPIAPEAVESVLPATANDAVPVAEEPLTVAADEPGAGPATEAAGVPADPIEPPSSGPGDDTHVDPTPDATVAPMSSRGPVVPLPAPGEGKPTRQTTSSEARDASGSVHGSPVVSGGAAVDGAAGPPQSTGVPDTPVPPAAPPPPPVTPPPPPGHGVPSSGAGGSCASAAGGAGGSEHGIPIALPNWSSWDCSSGQAALLLAGHGSVVQVVDDPGYSPD